MTTLVALLESLQKGTICGSRHLRGSQDLDRDPVEDLGTAGSDHPEAGKQVSHILRRVEDGRVLQQSLTLSAEIPTGSTGEESVARGGEARLESAHRVAHGKVALGSVALGLGVSPAASL